MRFGTWLKLLASGHFDVTLNRLPRILGVTLVAPFNSIFAILSEAIHGARAARTEVTPPVIVLGHWRTGTTLLQELLCCDPAHVFPTAYQCVFANSFLLAAPFAGAIAALSPPRKRPFDDMPFGFNHPLEEEFAFANRGMGTPYVTFAFPRHGLQGARYLDLAGLADEELAEWEAQFMWLVKRLQLAHGKRLVLKSPCHTARIPTLLKLFPEARFIHIARNPFDIFPSTIHAWRVFASDQGLQKPAPQGDEWPRDLVLDVFERLFSAYKRDRHLIPDGRLAEVRYEDLVADPKAILRNVYKRLDLGDFAAVTPGIDAYLGQRRDHRRNRFRLSDEDRRRVRARWESYFLSFGYPLDEAPP
jgi:hypothetical protein